MFDGASSLAQGLCLHHPNYSAFISIKKRSYKETFLLDLIRGKMRPERQAAPLIHVGQDHSLIRSYFFFGDRYPAYAGAGLLWGHRSGGGQSGADLARSLGIESLCQMQAPGGGVLLLGGGVRPNPARIQLSYGAARLLLCSATPIHSWGVSL